MSSIDFSKNNYEAKRILLNNILLENKDSIVLEQQNSKQRLLLNRMFAKE